MTCWRGECQRSCYYPDACNEDNEQPEPLREAFALGAAWALGDDDEAPAAVKARAESAEAELKRLKAAADKVGHQAACPVEPCDCWMRDLAPLLNDASEPECADLCGEHHWLDRPESDTRECLICGTEVAG